MVVEIMTGLLRVCCAVQVLVDESSVLGADTEDILQSLLGYSPQEVARLREEQVLY